MTTAVPLRRNGATVTKSASTRWCSHAAREILSRRRDTCFAQRARAGAHRAVFEARVLVKSDSWGQGAKRVRAVKGVTAAVARRPESFAPRVS
jgi:triphosphoribosyl-dephospho-CoA synthetase